MIKKQSKNETRYKRHARVRGKVFGTASVPRMNVYRSTSHIYVQLIDDVSGMTLASSSSLAKGVDFAGKTKSNIAEIVGKDVATKALSKGIKQVVFDRGGYIYTGRVRALADGARAIGLQF